MEKNKNDMDKYGSMGVELLISDEGKMEIPEFISDSLFEITDEEYQAILTGGINETDKLQIFHKLISNIILDDSLSKERAHEIFKTLLNREGSYDDAEVEFISYYILYLNYSRFKYDEDGKIRPGYEKVTIPRLVFTDSKEDPELTPNKIAAYYAGKNIIRVNRDSKALLFKGGDRAALFDYFQYLSHEMIHYRQDFESRNGMLTSSSFNNILSFIVRVHEIDESQNSREDSRNYHFRREEIEAQVESMQYAIGLVEEFCPDERIMFRGKMLNNAGDYMVEESLANMHDIDTLVLRDFYDINCLQKMVARNPNSLLKKFPQLLAFFDKDGHMRSEEELLAGYQSSKIVDSDVADIYGEFLVYIYHFDEVAQNTNLSPELLAVKTSFILEQIGRELIKLSEIQEIVSLHKKKNENTGETWELSNIVELIEMRKARLESYYKFLSSMKNAQSNNMLKEIEKIKDTYDTIIIDVKKHSELSNMIDGLDTKIYSDDNDKNIKG